MFHINKVIIAHPSLDITNIKNSTRDHTFKFIYPSFPRVYKNFELLCEATKRLSANNPKLKFEVLITLDGNENNYSRMLVKKYGNVENIRFIGLINRSELFKLYSQTDCLIFVSKLETWGMPISEFKFTSKKIIASKLPFAYETIGNYKNTMFVDVDSVEDLEIAMKKAINRNSFHYQKSNNITGNYVYAKNWQQLLKILKN